jgi:hypothetical protein
VFARGDALLATDFDPSSLRTSGNTVAIQAGFRALAGYGDTDFHLTGDGTLLHWPGGIYGDKRQLVFVEHDGGRRLRIGDAWSEELRFFEGGLTVSNDMSVLAVSITNDGGLYETWISDMDRPRLSRFAYEPGQDCTPMAWTPDDTSLIYTCRTTDESVLYLRRVDSNEQPRELQRWQAAENFFGSSFTPDGSSLIVTHFRQGETDLQLIPLQSGAGSAGSDEPWLEDADNGTVSADGRWLAYRSDVSGRNEIYLRPLRPDGSLGREIPVTTNGAGVPYWNDAASPPQIIYHRGDEMYVTDIGPDGTASAPRSLGSTTPLSEATGGHLHLADGRLLAIKKGPGEDLPDRVDFVLNWTTELEQRLAGAR